MFERENLRVHPRVGLIDHRQHGVLGKLSVDRGAPGQRVELHAREASERLARAIGQHDDVFDAAGLDRGLHRRIVRHGRETIAEVARQRGHLRVCAIRVTQQAARVR
jgi:hypothetical protein